MIAQEVIGVASAEDQYHEKIVNTPTSDLYPKTNAYDGSDNWTKYHHELNVAQGQAWCGFFLYWCFRQLFNTDAECTQFLHNIVYYGGGVDQWYIAFNSAGKWHAQNSGYTPKPGDCVIFSDTGYVYSHVELITGVPNWPYSIEDIGGNTRNPLDPGSQSEGMYVAARTRNAQTTSGFHVLGYCEVDYDGTPSPGYFDDITMLSAWLNKKKRRLTWY